MSAQQYLRKFSIVIADPAGQGLDFKDFRCTFYVQRGDSSTPNSADVRIYNVSKQTAARLASDEFTQLVIQAGYEGNYGIIFRGQLSQKPRTGRENAKDSYVDITAWDGDEPYNYAFTALSLPASQTAPKDAIEPLIAGMVNMAKSNARRGYIPELSTNKLPRGEVHFGNTSDCLRRFAESNDCNFSIQDGAITLIPQAAYIAGQVPVISPETGLIGVPTQTQNGLTLRVLLNPGLRIGQAIRLDSEVNKLRYGLDIESQRQNPRISRSTAKLNTDGLYYIMRAEHHGDTRGNDWYSDLTCLAVDATVPQDTQIFGAINPEFWSLKRY
jgi:hypothetical protein